MYKLFKTVSYGAEQVTIIKDNGNDQYTSFPEDPENPNYAAYLAWLEAGNTPDPAPEPEVTWDAIRTKRDQIIRDTDWTMTVGATVDQGAWASYRQILRDLPQTFAKTGPESVIWPTEPSTDGPNSTPVE
jgi:hypothetical protein